MKACGLPVERCNHGEPIIAPTSNWWETGVTFNAAAIYLELSLENDPIIQTLLPMHSLDDLELAEGVVAVHYRARPEIDPGSSFERSFIGLALFTPDLKPLYRYAMTDDRRICFSLFAKRQIAVPRLILQLIHDSLAFSLGESQDL